MIGMNVARRYARAILELGVESGNLDGLVTEIASAADTYAASPELRAVLGDPLVSHAAKRGILTDLGRELGLSPVASNALRLLGDRRRLGILPAIAQILKEMNDLRRGVVRAEVTTAVRLSEGYYAKLQEQLARMTGKTVVLDRREDPELIAGVVTRIGDTVVDGSLRARLEEMKIAMLAEENLRAAEPSS